MSEIILKRWRYLQVFRDGNEGELVIFFCKDEQLYETTIRQHEINFLLCQANVAKYMDFMGEDNNLITVDIKDETVRITHYAFFDSHFTNSDALAVAKHIFNEGRAYKVKRNL